MISRRRKKGRRKTQKRARRFYFIGGQGEDKCIFLQLRGGLGNQIYVYAAAMTVKRKIGLPLCLLPYKGNVHSNTDYTVELFTEGKPVDIADVKGRMNVSAKVLESVRSPHNIWDEENITANGTKNTVLCGDFFQSYSSIKHVIPDIRATFARTFEKKYPDVKGMIDSASSAFMHVRRGDYNKISLPAEHYKNALGLVTPHEHIKRIYILSDDIPWCKGVWAAGENKIEYIEEPDELKAMYIMSLCLGGAILSASTFSSWGAILGADQNPDSVIVYPANWITGPSSRIQFPERWKAIP